MAGKPKLNAKTVAAALRKAGGVKAHAARALGIERETLDSYIKRWGEVARAYEEANEVNLDMAESMLLRQVREGDAQQVRYYLDTKGRARGYGKTLAVTGKDGESLYPDAARMDALMARLEAAAAADAAASDDADA